MGSQHLVVKFRCERLCRLFLCQGDSPLWHLNLSRNFILPAERVCGDDPQFVNVLPKTMIGEFRFHRARPALIGGKVAQNQCFSRVSEPARWALTRLAIWIVGSGIYWASNYWHQFLQFLSSKESQCVA
jgi:hypothetical protein